MLHIFANTLEGKKFNTKGVDPTIEYTCVGFASNDTFLVVGATWEQASNRTILKTFKFQEVTFIGNLTKT